MRTDEKAGQAAKVELERLEAKDRDEAMMDPEGAYPFRTPDQRRIAHIQKDILRKIIGK